MHKGVSLKIALQNPIDGVLYGLQKGKGADYETIQAQLGKGQDLTFNFVVQLKETNASVPTLGGPFVQGNPGNRFVYIDIGTYAGQIGAPWSGRLKVPLPEADFQRTNSIDDGHCWSCTVPGRTDDNKPIFATVKPFDGWVVSKIHP